MNPSVSRVIQGRTAPRDSACAAAWHPDLIVVGSDGKTGLDRLILGSGQYEALRTLLTRYRSLAADAALQSPLPETASVRPGDA